LRRKLEHDRVLPFAGVCAFGCGAPRKPAKAGRKYHEEISSTIFLVVALVGSSFAQTPAKPGKKTSVQAKSKQSIKLVGTVKGTKPWAGDCVAAEPTAPAPAEPQSEPDKQ